MKPHGLVAITGGNEANMIYARCPAPARGPGVPAALCPTGRTTRATLSKRLGRLPAIVQKLEWLRKLRSEL